VLYHRTKKIKTKSGEGTEPLRTSASKNDLEQDKKEAVVAKSYTEINLCNNRRWLTQSKAFENSEEAESLPCSQSSRI
jgi:hypothetical protein